MHAKTQEAKAVKRSPAYLLVASSTAPWYFRAAEGGGSCPVILKRMMRALSRAFEGDDEPSSRQERRQKQPSSGPAKLQRRRLMGNGEASSEVDAVAVASWPHWERLPGGGSDGHGDDDVFFCVLCGAGGDFRGVVCLGFLFVMCADEA